MFGRLKNLVEKLRPVPHQNLDKPHPLLPGDDVSMVAENDFIVYRNNFPHPLPTMSELGGLTLPPLLAPPPDAALQRRLGEIMRYSQLPESARSARSVPIQDSSSTNFEREKYPYDKVICFRLDGHRGLRFQTRRAYYGCRKRGLELLARNGVFEVCLDGEAVTDPFKIEVLARRMEDYLAMEPAIAPTPAPMFQASRLGATSAPVESSRQSIRTKSQRLIRNHRPAYVIRKPDDQSHISWLRLGGIPPGCPNDACEMKQKYTGDGVEVEMMFDFPDEGLVSPSMGEKLENISRLLKEHMALQVARQLGMAPETTYIFEANVVPEEVNDSYSQNQDHAPSLLLAYRCRETTPARSITSAPLALNMKQLGYVLGCKELAHNQIASSYAIASLPDGRQLLLNPFSNGDPEPLPSNGRPAPELGKLRNKNWAKALTAALNKASEDTLAFAERHFPELSRDADLRDKKALTGRFLSDIRQYLNDCKQRVTLLS